VGIFAHQDWGGVVAGEARPRRASRRSLSAAAERLGRGGCSRSGSGRSDDSQQPQPDDLVGVGHRYQLREVRSLRSTDPGSRLVVRARDVRSRTTPRSPTSEWWRSPEPCSGRS
jgi:hypothetical protein